MEQNVIVKSGKHQIPCVITCPEGHAVRQVVLGVHGFGGSSQDAIQQAIAEEMTMFCDASVRFDFPSHGENPDDRLSLQSCRETLLAVARYAKGRFPEVTDLCIFATGLGAFVTLCVLEELTELPGQIRLVIQTPSLRMHNALLTMLRTSEQTLRAMGKVTLPVPGRPLTVTYDFYQEVKETLVLASQAIPMLILHGEEDDYIPMEDIRNFRRINEDAKLVLIPGATHRFLEEGVWDMVLDLTRDWFAFQQVLLCDWE
jgi:alpha-beta hydrolase superfamily lysophospholipase